MRAAYIADVRFFADSDATIKIRWYRTTKPFLAVPTIFNSQLWDDENGPHSGMLRGQLLQGEQLSPVSFTNGNPPAAFGTLNRGPCGTPAQFNGDLLVARDLPLVPDVNGNPTCCTGLAPAALCVNCPGGIASPTMYLVCTDATGRFAAANGVWPLSYAGNCTWQSVQFRVDNPGGHFAFWELQHRSPLPAGAMQVGIRKVGFPGYDLITDSNIGWNCQATVPVFSFFGPIPAGCPAQVYNVGPSVPEFPMFIGQIAWDVAPVGPAPFGFLVADGAAVSRVTYAALFARIGVFYGPGDGLTTFNLPDLRDRCIVGSGVSFGTGATGGEPTHLLTVAEMPSHAHLIADPQHSHAINSTPHNHNIADPGHSHGVTDPGHDHIEQWETTGAGGANFAFGAGENATPQNVSAHTVANTTGLTVNAANTGILSTLAATQLESISTAPTDITVLASGGGGPHNNLQPFMALRPLIFTGV